MADPITAAATVVATWVTNGLLAAGASVGVATAAGAISGALVTTAAYAPIAPAEALLTNPRTETSCPP